MYHERPLSIPGAAIWAQASEAESAENLPDGCMDLHWTDAELPRRRSREEIGAT